MDTITTFTDFLIYAAWLIAGSTVLVSLYWVIINFSDIVWFFEKTVRRMLGRPIR